MPSSRNPTSKAPPRLLIEVTEEQFSTIKRFLPYGFQRQVFGAVIQDLVQMWDIYGDDFTKAMLAKNITYKQFMGDYLERHYGYSERSKDFSLSHNELGRTAKIYKGNTSLKEDSERAQEKENEE